MSEAYQQGPPPAGFAPPSNPLPGVPPPSNPPPGVAPPSNPPPYIISNTTQPQPNVVIIGATPFGPNSQQMTCPHCHASITTRVESEPSTKTHLFAFFLCMVGCFLCAPCPYCMDECLSQKHFCPSCKSYLGQYAN